MKHKSGTELWLSPTECAMVTEENGSDISFYTPNPDVCEHKLTRAQKFLVSCAMRYYQDITFVEEVIDWLKKTLEKAGENNGN